MRRSDNFTNTARVVRADVEAEVTDILDFIAEHADELGADLATIEIVRLRLGTHLVEEVGDDDD